MDSAHQRVGIMDNEIDLGATSTFPVDELVRVEAGKTTCVLVRNSEGNISVFEDKCTHLNMAIADGRVDGASIVCPWHGAYFDVETGESQSPLADAPLKKLSTRVVDGRVLCGVEG